MRGKEGKPRYQVDIIIKNQDGDTLAYCRSISKIGTDYRMNELPLLEFLIPSDENAIEYLVNPNEAWLYIDGDLEYIYLIADKEISR